ncbi:hypothetical protein FGG01_00670, partial [Xylella fastidiosa subsp. multiplex]|nr:hypothetical protein [Xylella fastidiosa subsp. multiplex]
MRTCSAKLCQPCGPEAANPAPVRGLHDVEDKLFAVIGTCSFLRTPWVRLSCGRSRPRSRMSRCATYFISELGL